MNFAVPADLEGQVLYWWKIVDKPTILLDELHNFIAFDLFLASLEKTKATVRNAIAKGLLVEEGDSELIRLAPPLAEKFAKWQENGHEKVLKMHKTLRHSWRLPLEITQNLTYSALLSDIIDISVYERAGKIRASAIKLSQEDFTQGIVGRALEYDADDNEIFFDFTIDPKNRVIHHACPDYLAVRKEQKTLCAHLARVFMKLYANNDTATFALVNDLVRHRDAWSF